jgi:hypothetical protein
VQLIIFIASDVEKCEDDFLCVSVTSVFFGFFLFIIEMGASLVRVRSLA